MASANTEGGGEWPFFGYYVMSDDAISPYVHGMINSIGARWAFEVDLVVNNQIVHGYLS